MDFKWHTCYNLVPNILSKCYIYLKQLNQGWKKKDKREWNYLLITSAPSSSSHTVVSIMSSVGLVCLGFMSGLLIILSFFSFLFFFSFFLFSTLRCPGLTLHQGRVVLPHFHFLNYRSWNLVGYSASDYLHCHWAVVWNVCST